MKFLRESINRKKIFEGKHQSKEKYKEIIDNINVIILKWTFNGRITYINEFGREFFSSTFSDLIPDITNLEYILTQLIEHFNNSPHSYESLETLYFTKDKKKVWIAWNNKIIYNEKGELKDILSVGTNITTHKSLDQFEADDLDYKIFFRDQLVP